MRVTGINMIPDVRDPDWPDIVDSPTGDAVVVTSVRIANCSDLSEAALAKAVTVTEVNVTGQNSDYSIVETTLVVSGLETLVGQWHQLCYNFRGQGFKAVSPSFWVAGPDLIDLDPQLSGAAEDGFIGQVGATGIILIGVVCFFLVVFLVLVCIWWRLRQAEAKLNQSAADASVEYAGYAEGPMKEDVDFAALPAPAANKKWAEMSVNQMLQDAGGGGGDMARKQAAEGRHSHDRRSPEKRKKDRRKRRRRYSVDPGTGTASSGGSDSEYNEGNLSIDSYTSDTASDTERRAAVGGGRRKSRVDAALDAKRREDWRNRRSLQSQVATVEEKEKQKQQQGPRKSRWFDQNQESPQEGGRKGSPLAPAGSVPPSVRSTGRQSVASHISQSLGINPLKPLRQAPSRTPPSRGGSQASGQSRASSRAALQQLMEDNRSLRKSLQDPNTSNGSPSVQQLMEDNARMRQHLEETKRRREAAAREMRRDGTPPPGGTQNDGVIEIQIEEGPNSELDRSINLPGTPPTDAIPVDYDDLGQDPQTLEAIGESPSSAQSPRSGPSRPMALPAVLSVAAWQEDQSPSGVQRQSLSPEDTPDLVISPPTIPQPRKPTSP
uniref:Uncharacterized protein n=2 Tax=Eutreptiella gymnastica TaxID=73025 RepID=A0A7S1IXS6_9EUGL|mmetsp:Transcript_51503/g.91934  ORF Transcript_51503/g.91934 Transcript_51503/m.91934 type:complete len:607 (+) Transcript_51503:104-1924(+)